MTSFGYALSSEEHPPADLVRHARLAEEAGFEFAIISDHFHPWIDRQGNSPFVWSVLGGIATATERIQVGTGVTCPTIRIHPAIIAQAAATTAAMMPGRFFLGVGTGENLNEHVLGDEWPDWDVRARMLEESVALMRELWRGEVTSFAGEFYRVENARLYTLPEEPVPIMVAAAGPRGTELAGRIGDGFIATTPKPERVQAFDMSRPGVSRPHYGQLTVCWDPDEKKARRTAHELWPIAAIPGDAFREQANPADFERLAEAVTEEMVAEEVICGPDVDRYVEAIEEFVAAGFEHVYIHQVGPEQEGFIEAFARDVLPRVGKRGERAAGV